MPVITDFTCSAFHAEVYKGYYLFVLRNFIYYKFVYGHLYMVTLKTKELKREIAPISFIIDI
jgi:hypothetical protein